MTRHCPHLTCGHTDTPLAGSAEVRQVPATGLQPASQSPVSTQPEPDSRTSHVEEEQEEEQEEEEQEEEEQEEEQEEQREEEEQEEQEEEGK